MKKSCIAAGSMVKFSRQETLRTTNENKIQALVFKLVTTTYCSLVEMMK